MKFAIDADAPVGLVTIDTQTVQGRKPIVSSVWGDYFPETYRGGKLIVGCTYGDANCGGSVANILDSNSVVNYIFRNGTTDLMGGDVNASGSINIVDLNYLVNRIFRNGPPPPPPPG